MTKDQQECVALYMAGYGEHRENMRKIIEKEIEGVNGWRAYPTGYREALEWVLEQI